MRPFALVASVVLALSVLIPIPETSQGKTISEYIEEAQEAYRMGWAKTWMSVECRRIPTTIVYAPAEHSRIPYPTKEDVETILHSKLRAKHLYVNNLESTGVSLYIVILPMISLYEVEPDVVLTESEFHALNELVWMEFEFYKRLYDPWKQEHTKAQAWTRRRAVGVSQLHENIAELMDEFLEDYLLYNDSACQRR